MRVYRIDSSKKRRLDFGMSLTVQLIIINIIFYFFMILGVGLYGDKIISLFALTPAVILTGKNLWSLLTSMFIHGSFFHLFANMFSLFFVGGFLEKIIGKKRFFWVYLIAGLIGGIFYIFATIIFGGSNIPAVGASGAIFGLLGVLAVLVPNSKIYLITGPLILIVIEVVAVPFLPIALASAISAIVNILILIMIFAIFSFNENFRKFAVPVELPMWLLPIIAIIPLSIIGLFVDLPIGNSAHFGGLIVGLIYGLYLKKKFPRKTAKLSKMFH
ncbi:MAG: rhomboid family intramembrane serine protease [Nanoarchaeota archaeon]